MKKLERLLEKLIGDKQPIDIIKDIVFLVELVVLTFVGIYLASSLNNYIMLSVIIFFWVGLIKETFLKKELFKKLNNYLRETPKATTLIFLIISVIILVLSWKYFIGMIFSSILAFIFIDYIDN